MTRTILLVEDDPGIADPLQMALRREGWQVIWHSTIQQAHQTVVQASGALDAVQKDDNPSAADAPKLAAEDHADMRSQGEWAAIEGWPMRPPGVIRKKPEREAWEKGWLAGKRKRDIALEGLAPVTVGDRFAAPVHNGRDDMPAFSVGSGFQFTPVHNGRDWAQWAALQPDGFNSRPCITGELSCPKLMPSGTVSIHARA